jgi:hypothetical protein
MTTEERTGAALELQRALEKLHSAHGDLWTAFNSAGTAAAASVMVLVFTEIENIKREIETIKARLTELEG